MSQSPSLVFAPGSWHKPICYEKIIKILSERYTLKCVTVTLPSTLDNASATFKDDIDAAREVIAGQTNHGRDVVIIAHSYGGMVGNSAIKGFARPSDASARASPLSESSDVAENADIPSATTGKGSVIGLVLMASGFTLTGLSFMDPFFGRPPPSWRVNKETGYAELVTPPRELFYHDLPADEAEYYVSQLTTQSLKALFEGGEHAYAGWQDVPAWYIGTIEDRGLPVAAQRMQIGMARAMGGRVEHRELQTSHSPFLSRPEETVEIIVEAIEAFTGQEIVAGTVRKASPTFEIAGPRVVLWQPLSWVEFGLPLLFGRIVGKCLLLFGWGRKK